jgi:superfamily I DNA/RNA helicase
LAVAGGRKTQQIAERVSALNASDKCLVLTFTLNGQQELQDRIKATAGHMVTPEVAGWYSFLLNHIVRPYLPALFDGVKATGLHFVQSENEIPRWSRGSGWYLDAHGRVYSNRLGVLANKILAASNNAPIRRLEGIYDHLLIDEIQDLAGNDLDILEQLMRSKMQVCMVGDVRQSVITTSRSDTKNRQYTSVQMVDWFREKQTAGLCKITDSVKTWRFNASIASFSDVIHDSALQFPQTISLNDEITGHDGVFLVNEGNLDSYMAKYSPTVLRYNASRKSPEDAEIFTFKSAKGLTRDRVVILSTQPIVKLLTNGTNLTSQSACDLYVATTRARSSVALVVDDAAKVKKALHGRFEGIVDHWSEEDKAVVS